MVGRFQSYSSRGKRLARGALRLAVAVTAVAFLTLTSARESQACAGAETSAAATALEAVLVTYVVDTETASVLTGQAVENLKCCGAGSHHRSSAPCSSGHCSTCWMAVPIVRIATVSPDDFAGHVLKRDLDFLPTGQSPKFRPPCIVA